MLGETAMLRRQLRPISIPDNVPKLLEILQSSWPKSLVPCYVLTKVVRWMLCFPEMKPLLLTPEGSCHDGSFVLVEPEVYNNVFLYFAEDDVSELKQMLVECEYIDWSKRTTFGPTASKFHPMLEAIFKEKNLVRYAGYEDVNTQGFWLPKKEALELLEPELQDAYLGPIKEEFAELLDSTWPHRYPGSLQIIQYMLKADPGVCIYVKETNEPVCWFLRDEYGLPGLLFTQPGHRGKGYARAATVAIARSVAQQGLAPNVFIVKTNKSSQALFSNLGFQPHDYHSWFCVEPSESVR